MTTIDYADPKQCSRWLADHEGGDDAPVDVHRECMIAVASTYIEAEQNAIPPDDILYAPTVSVGLLGTELRTMTAEENRDRIWNGSTAVIAKIANRRWMVDGEHAFIIYDGYLTTNPDAPGFYVAERFTIRKGLITEILICAVQHPSAPPD